MRRRLAKPLVVAALGVGLSLVPAVLGVSIAAARSRCKYLKVSEVAAILDTPVKKGPNPAGPSNTQTCSFVPKDLALPSSVNAWVDTGTEGKIAFSVAKDAFKASLESSPDFGSKSFYVGGGLNTEYVLKGSTLVYVQYVDLGGDPDVIKSAVFDLTKLVLGRV